MSLWASEPAEAPPTAASPENPSPRLLPRELAAVLVVALAVRGAVLLAAGGSLEADPDGYRRLAENLWQHGTLGYGTRPTAYRPPLYPLLLVPCVAFGPAGSLAIGVLHLLLGVATVGGVYWLGRRTGLGRLAILAAVLVACDPLLLEQSRLVMTESLAAFLVVVALGACSAAGQRPSPYRAAVAGGSIAAAALCRPVFLVWGILVLAALPVLFRRHSRRWAAGAACIAGGLAVLAPWAVRNQVHFGRPIVATTHGGYTLLLANNPSFYRYVREGRWGEVWDAEAFHADWARQLASGGPRAEREDNRRAYAAAWATIRGDPAGFFRSPLVRAGRFWQLAPRRVESRQGPAWTAARLLVGCWYLVQFSLAAVGASSLMARRAGRSPKESQDGLPPRRSVAWAGLLLAISCTAVHTVFWSNMRMRAPLVPAIAWAAAWGWEAVGNRLSKSMPRRRP